MEEIYVVKSNNVGIRKAHIIVERTLWTDKGREFVIANTTMSAPHCITLLVVVFATICQYGIPVLHHSLVSAYIDSLHALPLLTRDLEFRQVG